MCPFVVVQQFDFHLPSLTVFETLSFHAHLRLSGVFSAEELTQRIRYVVNVLSLRDCLHVRVGNEEMKGISG